MARALTLWLVAAAAACSAFVVPAPQAAHRTTRTSVCMAAHQHSLADAARGALAAGLLPLACAAVVAGAGVVAPAPAAAVSGGGLDYSGLKLSGQDFSKGKYQGKDFSGVIAKETNFKASNLKGARFFKADLDGADFAGADLSAASLEGANLTGTNFKNAVLSGTYFSETLENVGSIAGADFTEASMRKDVQKQLCAREDAAGTNPTTGVDTRESLLCDLL